MAVEANRMIRVRALGDDETGEDELAWQGFIDEWPDANLYHTLKWRDLIQAVFRHEPLYLMACRGGRVTGVLPLFRVHAPVLGSKLISLPYDAASGGPLAVDGESERALAEAALRIAETSGELFLQLRCCEERPALSGLGADTTQPVLVSEVALDDGDQVWSRIAQDHRRSLGKA